MIKTTAFIGLSLCVLLLSGCAPKIDGSSAKAYENSIIKVASGLDPEKREIFKVATDIVISRTPALPNIDDIANARAALAGKSADDVINEATLMAKKAVNENSNELAKYNEIVEKLKNKTSEDRVILGKFKVTIQSIQRKTMSERYKLAYGEEYDRLYWRSIDNPEILWRSRISQEHFVAKSTVQNLNGFDVTSLVVRVTGFDVNGKQRWTSKFDVLAGGGIPANGKRTFTTKLPSPTGEYSPDNMNWLQCSEKPTLDVASISYNILEARSNGTLYSSDTDTSMRAPTLPEDIDRFLTLIKYKR